MFNEYKNSTYWMNQRKPAPRFISIAISCILVGAMVGIDIATSCI